MSAPNKDNSISSESAEPFYDPVALRMYFENTSLTECSDPSQLTSYITMLATRDLFSSVDERS